MSNIIRWITLFVFLSGLTGCLAASNKAVRFTCNQTIKPDDFKRGVTAIAKAHQFDSAPTPSDGSLWFYSKIKSAPRLYAEMNTLPPAGFILGITIIRGPGTEDKLPVEVLDVFNSIVDEVSKSYENSCHLEHR